MESKEFKMSQIFNLEQSIDFSTDSIISKTILKKETGNISLFSFDKGQQLSEHTAPFDAMVYIVDGEADIIIDKKRNWLKKGEMIIMPANIPHAVEAREKFTAKGAKSVRENLMDFDNIIMKREWLVENVKGMGFKEASHYLRNIGLGKDIAILDRHIIKNMKLLNIIDEIPKTITKKGYYEMEDKLRTFSKKVRIPLSHIDFVLWYREAGDVFK